MKRNGKKAVQEILDKVRTGEYLLTENRHAPLQARQPANSALPWVKVNDYHLATINAAKDRLVYQFDETHQRSVYRFPVVAA